MLKWHTLAKKLLSRSMQIIHGKMATTPHYWTISFQSRSEIALQRCNNLLHSVIKIMKRKRASTFNAAYNVTDTPTNARMIRAKYQYLFNAFNWYSSCLSYPFSQRGPGFDCHDSEKSVELWITWYKCSEWNSSQWNINQTSNKRDNSQQKMSMNNFCIRFVRLYQFMR